MLEKLLTEACAPYSSHPDLTDPVDIWAMIDRLTQDELRSLVMSYAIRASAAFEHKLLDIWKDRQRAARAAADAARSETGDVT